MTRLSEARIAFESGKLDYIEEYLFNVKSSLVEEDKVNVKLLLLRYE